MMKILFFCLWLCFAYTLLFGSLLVTCARGDSVCVLYDPSTQVLIISTMPRLSASQAWLCPGSVSDPTYLGVLQDDDGGQYEGRFDFCTVVVNGVVIRKTNRFIADQDLINL